MLSMVIKGTKEVIKAIENDAKQMKFAGALALTRTAVIAKKELTKEMEKSFDRPKPFTTKSIKITKATKANLQASIEIKPLTARYLAHQVTKQDRPTKAFEQALRSKGLLPSGMYVVPGPGVKLNKFGNVGRAAVKKMVSEASRPGGKYFVAKINGTAGVWQRYGRRGRKIKPVLLFVRKPNYRPRFDFYGTAERVFKTHFEKEFDKALEHALGTAR